MLLIYTYFEFLQRRYLKKGRPSSKIIFTIVNSYFLINVGRFKLSLLFYKRNMLDLGIELSLLYFYVCLELVSRLNQSYPKKLHNVKNMLKITQNRRKILADFRKLFASTCYNLIIASVIVVYFFLISQSFKISFVNLSLPVN